MDSEKSEKTEETAEGKSGFIVLLRHGIAEDRTAGKPDDDRSLTSEGHAKMKWIARGLERAFPKAQAIYTSPLLRAMQTALWVSKAYRSRVAVTTDDAVAPGHGTDELRDLIARIRERRVIFVGHEPNLSENFAALVGLNGRRMELKKGGCYGIRVNEDGSAELEWMLTPRVLRKLGEEK
ncbi:MAG: phosphoglycerate mutase family protein [Thermoanaerobaculia bacterium]